MAQTLLVGWQSPDALSSMEKRICKRLKRTGRLFAFLRRYRHKLIDEEFAAELAAMYSDSPRGTSRLRPEVLVLATLLQAYEQKSDAAAVEEAVFDMRWQMVLGCLGAEAPPFSQGALCDFRHRLIYNNMDQRLIERTVELARASRGQLNTRHPPTIPSASRVLAGSVNPRR